MGNRRVVVTGLGIVTSLGNDVAENWDAICNSKSGVSEIESFDASSCETRFASEIKHKSFGGLFDPSKEIDPKEIRRISKFITYGLYATAQAVRDAGLDDLSNVDSLRCGVFVGSGIGGLDEICDTYLSLYNDKKRVSPFFLPSVLINLISGQIAIRYGFKGSNVSHVSACATGNHSIGEAYRSILLGDNDVMICGGAEAAICHLGMVSFNALKALSTRNDSPKQASRPWDKDRDGFVMGDGAGILVIEEYDHAKKRGAKIYGEIVGYGLSCDAYHITGPESSGDGGKRAMEMAIKSAKISNDKIDYINAHGTSTPLGDEIEINAMRSIFGDDLKNIPISSTKSATGHLLGAAGAIEAVYSILAIRDGVIPPTLNLDNPADSCIDLNLVPHNSQKKKVNYALSNSFGFGGTNSSLIFGKI
jgi:3-oxoacyl-[acyl-carrier-protein] synthase II